MPPQPVLLPEDVALERQHRFSLWWVSHRDSYKERATAFWFVFIAVLGLWAIWVHVDSYLISYEPERSMVASLAFEGQEDLRGYTTATAPKKIATNEPIALTSGAGRYDLTSFAENQNDDWWVEFIYAFEIAGKPTGSTHSFLLPHEKKPLTFFGVEQTNPPTGSRLVLSNIQWHRIDPFLVGDFNAWKDKRLNIIPSKIIHASDLQIEAKTVARTTFTVTNQTAWSYYEPAFWVVLKRGANVIGVNRTTIGSLDAGEAHEVQVDWFGAVPSASSAEVIVDINPFIPSSYKPLQGESMQDVRTRVQIGR